MTITGLCEGIYDNFVAKTAGVCVSNTLGPDTLTAPPIVAGFTYNVHEGCEGDTVVFTNSSTPASDLSYQWNFGDGASDTATNPTHVYYSPGSLNVTLTITNTRCYDSAKQIITLNNLIAAGFTETPDSFLCQDKAVVFTNTSTGTGLKYTWYFGDGATDTSASNTHTYKRAGVYDIILAVTNFVPCYDTVIKTLSVDSISAISIQATDSVICGGTTITFSGLFSGLGNTGVYLDIWRWHYDIE